MIRDRLAEVIAGTTPPTPEAVAAADRVLDWFVVARRENAQDWWLVRWKNFATLTETEPGAKHRERVVVIRWKDAR